MEYAVICVLKVDADTSWAAREKAYDALVTIPKKVVGDELTEDPYILRVEEA